MAEKQTNKERLKDITDSIERGIQDLFQSDCRMLYGNSLKRIAFSPPWSKIKMYCCVLRQDDGGVFMNKNNVALGRVTRKRMHEYYKNFVGDPDIFMDMSRYFEYQYSPERIDRYWETRKKPKDRKDFFVLLKSEVIGELALKHIDFEKKECELSIHLQNDSVKNKGYGSTAERLALAYAFESLGMERVLADSVLKNTRSQHVLEKVGFVQIGADDTFKYYRCDKNAFPQNCT